MKLRGWGLSMARSFGFALGAALLCRLLAPTVRPGPVEVPVAPMLVAAKPTAEPEPAAEPEPTPWPTLSRAERQKQARVEAFIDALRDFDIYTGDARLFERNGDVPFDASGSYRYDKRKVARIERRVVARLRRLVREGVNVNGFTEHGSAPIHDVASTEGNPNPLRLALRFGCDPNLRSVSSESGEGGTTPLEATFIDNETTYFNIVAARELLRAGANPNAPFSNELTPLIAALHLPYNREAAVQLMLSAKANPNLPDNRGFTPLMHAASGVSGDHSYYMGRRSGDKSNSASVRLLLDAGAVLEARDRLGQTALMHAVAYFYDRRAEDGGREQGFVGVYDADGVRLLLKRGANVNARDKNGRTALHLAVRALDDSYDEQNAAQRRVKTMGILLENGATLEARDTAGNTPLLSAMHAYYGSTAPTNFAILPVRLLLQRGANLNARNASGQNALDLARREPVITQLLESRGARKAQLRR